METKKRTIQMPHTYVIIFFVILFAAVLTLLIITNFAPQKKFEK